MKVLQINSVCGIRSTGRICTDIADILTREGHECRIAWGREAVPPQFQQYAVRVGRFAEVLAHGGKARLFDAAGLGSVAATRRFVKWIKAYDPDVIHIHNIHEYYINFKVLFQYLKQSGKPVVWTLHDCWSFTGHCTYFDIYRCERWKTGCGDCPQRKNYPKSLFFDRSARNFELKKRYCATLPDLTLVPPSKWLGGLLEQSLFAEGPARIRVINNGIDLNSFSPTPSNFREKNGLEGKKILLGVANPWGERKGLDDFLYLREHLGEEYAIVLVGLSPEQRDALPEGILGILRTNSVKELAQIYTAADIFLNPTYEDNYPTVNMEAQACGTPVITYRTGGSPENVDPASGVIVERGDRAALLDAVQRFVPRPVQGAERFDKNLRFREYIELYRELCGEK